MPTHTTRSGGIRLLDPLDRDANTRRLLGEGAGELPMRPLADLLVRLLAQTHPRLDVTHIPHREVGDAFLGTEADHLPGGLVQQIALLPIEFRARLGFALEQPFGPARTHLTTAQLLLQEAMDLERRQSSEREHWRREAKSGLLLAGRPIRRPERSVPCVHVSGSPSFR